MKIKFDHYIQQCSHRKTGVDMVKENFELEDISDPTGYLKKYEDEILAARQKLTDKRREFVRYLKGKTITFQGRHDGRKGNFRVLVDNAFFNAKDTDLIIDNNGKYYTVEKILKIEEPKQFISAEDPYGEEIWEVED